MNEIILIKVLLFFEICRMSLKCLKNFPQEYFKETAFMVKHIFSYSGFMITLLVFVFIEKISQFLYIDEVDLFVGICLAIGFFSIRFFQKCKRKCHDLWRPMRRVKSRRIKTWPLPVERTPLLQEVWLVI